MHLSEKEKTMRIVLNYALTAGFVIFLVPYMLYKGERISRQSLGDKITEAGRAMRGWVDKKKAEIKP